MKYVKGGKKKFFFLSSIFFFLFRKYTRLKEKKSASHSPQHKTTAHESFSFLLVNLIYFLFFFSLCVERRRQPIETLIETVSSSSASGLDVPLASAERVQAELVGDLRDGHGVRKILLVGEDKNDDVLELLLPKHLVEFLSGLANSLTIVRVDHKDETLGVLEVVAPERANLVLTADIPNSERDLLVLDSLDVEADGGNSSNNLTKLELVEDGGLT